MGQKRIDYISFEEYKKIRKACNDLEMRFCIDLGFGSGLRISEIIGYQRIKKRKKDKQTGQINWLEDKTFIPKLTKEMIDLKSHQIRLEEGKGGKWRSTVTSPIITDKMIEMLPIQLPRRTVQYRFQQLCKRVLGKKMSFHTLRHGFGNYQANVLGVPLPIVQQMMGHSRLDTTGIYTRANPEQAIAASWKAMGGA